jgi:hypothetical protein
MKTKNLILVSLLSALFITVSAFTPGYAAQTNAPGYKCDPSSGICYCTGGSQSEDCKKLGDSPDCGQKFGCDGSGRCFCIPKAPRSKAPANLPKAPNKW